MEQKDGTSKFRHQADPQVSLARLARDKKFPRPLIDKLKPHAIPDRRNQYVSLNSFVRGYLQSLGRIHKELQLAIAPRVERWDGTILGALHRAEAAFGTTAAVVYGEYYDDSNDELNLPRPAPEEDVFSEPIERRKFLANRTELADRMPGADDYISNE